MTEKNQQTILKDTIVSAIQEKKGKELVVLDMSNLEQSITDYFIICHGDSNIQVDAISEFIERQIKTELHENTIHKEGTENSLWVLLDYGDVVVHVFQQEQRSFYKLEELWADAKIQHINEE